MGAESEDGLMLDTVQVYSPPVVTVRVCVYCAVSGSSNTVSVPSVTVVEPLVQVTVVAGPPVEIQVSKLKFSTTPCDIEIPPNNVLYIDYNSCVSMNHIHNAGNNLTWTAVYINK